MFFAIAGCAAPSPRGSEDVRFGTGREQADEIPEAQLQDEILRFTSRFSEKIQDAMRELEKSPDPEIRSQALLRRLLYNSSALDIALGPSPEANLLDMVAFIELSRAAWQDYWIPEVFGSQGEPLSHQLHLASQEIWEISAQVLDPTQRSRLAQLIARWRQDHPHQILVEAVRLSQFSAEAGARAKEMQKDVGGLLANVEAATALGDRALLFSERALYYAQRAPFLWRMQAKAAARDVFNEAMLAFSSAEELLESEPKLRALIRDMNTTLSSVNELLAQASKHPQTMELSSNLVGHLAEILTQWNRSLSDPKLGATLSGMSDLAREIDAGANRLLWKVFLLGAGLILLFGFVLLGSRFAFRALSRRYLRSKRVRRPPSLPSHPGQAA